MKILKTLAVLFVLLALTVGAVAEVKYEPFAAGEVTIKLPTGLKCTEFKNCETPGVIQIKVDSTNTDWSAVISDVDDRGEITFALNWNLDGAAACNATPGMVTLPDAEDWSFDAYYDVQWGYKACYEEMIKHTPSATCYAEGKLAEYDINTNTLVPFVRDGVNGYYLMAVFYNADNEAYRVKYATMQINHTNENAFQAKLNYVPEERIVLSTAVGTNNCEKGDGSATYTLANGNTLQQIETLVKAPSGAVTYRATGYVEETGSADEGVTVKMNGIREKDYYNSKAASIIWYDADGKILLAERLDVYVSVGTPKAWPNYITDEQVTKADATFTVGKSADAATSSIIKADYDKDSGTVNVYADGEMPNEDMTQYKLFCKIKAPEGAAFCAHVTYEYIKFLGSSTTSSRYQSNAESLSDPVLEPLENGVFVYEEDLFRIADFANDTGLRAYYDVNSTKANTGDVTMIDWYDADGKYMSRQWIAKTYEPLAHIVPVPVANAVPTEAENPTLIADAGDGYKLQVTSYPQTTESGTQIQYELQLLDPAGNTALLSELSGTVQLLIPYPENVDLDGVTFTVNHYQAVAEATGDAEAKDEKVSAKDSYVEGVSLERTDAGVLMTVTSLSPFVLSWEEVECEHADSEKYTYKVKDNVFIVSCDCGENGTFTIDLVESYTAGEALDCSITTDNWFGPEPDAVLVDEKGNELTEMPTVPGKYTLKFSIENAEKEFTFEVLPAPAMPATGDNSLPLATLMGMLALALTGAFMLRRKVNG